MRETRRHIAALVRTARQRQRLTQEQLAEKIERSSVSISKLERRLVMPEIDTVIRIAHALGLDLAEFDPDRRPPVHASPERAAREAQVTQVIRDLTDRDLMVVIDLIESFRRHGGGGRNGR
ncbi:MAG: helix-turn-helix transcriptional regulator [Alphaproteobacteria bacterium]|nr:helix-turn-helix transcriptional regulator [Alphaproteobacteria bacterium]